MKKISPLAKLAGVGALKGTSGKIKQPRGKSAKVYVPSKPVKRKGSM